LEVHSPTTKGLKEWGNALIVIVMSIVSFLRSVAASFKLQIVNQLVTVEIRGVHNDLDPRAIDGLRKRGLSWLLISKTLGASVTAIRRAHAEWLGAEAPRKSKRTQQTKRPASRTKAVGRPRRDDLDPVLIDALRRRGLSWREIAKAGHAGTGTIIRIYKSWLFNSARQKKERTPQGQSRQRKPT
jgi:hypothetical protein